MKAIKCVPDTLMLQYNPEKNSLLASWDFSRAYQNLIHVHTGLPVTLLPLLLRVYDVTGMYFDGCSCSQVDNYPVLNAECCSFPAPTHGRELIADLGCITETGRFITFLRSERWRMQTYDLLQVPEENCPHLSFRLLPPLEGKLSCTYTLYGNFKQKAEYSFSGFFQTRIYEDSNSHFEKILPEENLYPAIQSCAPSQSWRILMFSWEYPPHQIGGLGRAVCDLAEELALLGHSVHVLTCWTEGLPWNLYQQGVWVHRIPPLQSLQPASWLDSMFTVNLGIIRRIHQLQKQYGNFDLIHAHDWMMGYAAIWTRETLGLPLALTMHATECGRRLGNLLEGLS